MTVSLWTKGKETHIRCLVVGVGREEVRERKREGERGAGELIPRKG